MPIDLKKAAAKLRGVTGSDASRSVQTAHPQEEKIDAVAVRGYETTAETPPSALIRDVLHTSDVDTTVRLIPLNKIVRVIREEDKDMDEYQHSIGPIEIGVHQPRETFTEEDTEALADAIHATKQKQPGVVYSRSDGSYRLGEGERRYRAICLNHRRYPDDERFECFRATVEHETPEGGEVLLNQAAENVSKRDLTPLEEANTYFRLVNDFGFNQTKIAKVAGVDRATVIRRLQLHEELDKDPVARARVLSGELSPHQILEARKAQLAAEQADTTGSNEEGNKQKAKKPKPSNKTPNVSLPSTTVRNLCLLIATVSEQQGRALQVPTIMVPKDAQSFIATNLTEVLEGIAQGETQ